MIDYLALRERYGSMAEMQTQFTASDLRRETNVMVDRMLALIADAVDADVTFLPQDPEAHDPYASDASERGIAWTLGHVVVHTTASAEESAALAAELARGVPYRGRSRREVPWRVVTTIAQCRIRLEESRRMRLASLQMWPDEPVLDNTYVPWPSAGEINAVGRFLLGLTHDHDHLGQIEEIVRQARAARHGDR